jgi:hypothetical protein
MGEDSCFTGHDRALRIYYVLLMMYYSVVYISYKCPDFSSSGIPAMQGLFLATDGRW